MTKPPARRPSAAKPRAKPVADADADQSGPVERQHSGAGGALRQIQSLLAEASAEASSALEDALDGLESAFREYQAVLSMKGEAGGHDEALRDARGRLARLMAGLDGGAVASAPRRVVRASGGAVSGGGAPRGPRGETGAKVLAILADAPGGLGASAIIQKLGASDPKEVQSVRNFLNSGQKNGTVHYEKSLKLYRKA